jgi:cell shape-determining protein MreC
LVGVVKLLKKEFEQVLNTKDNEIYILSNENFKLRELLEINKNISFPTKKG